MSVDARVGDESMIVASAASLRYSAGHAGGFARSAAIAGAMVATMLATGCGDRKESAAMPVATPTAPASVNTPPPAGGSAAMPGAPAASTVPAAPSAMTTQPAPPVGASTQATTTQSAPAPAPTTGAVQLPLDVQGVATVGLTVRVKGIELGEDATVLRISASFGGQAASYTKLAAVDTYLEDPDGNRLMLKRPPDNKDLKIMNGDTMDGQLVFLGRVPRNAAQVRLVINDGSTSDNSIGPGLAIVLPLKG